MTLCSLFAAVLSACGGGTSETGAAVTAAPAAAATVPVGTPEATDSDALGASNKSQKTLAAEGQSFTVSGTQTVRYGADSRWVQKIVTSSGQCTNGFFGSDPAIGTVKACELITTSTTSAPAPAPSPTADRNAPAAPAPAPAPTPAPAPAPAPSPAPTPAPAPSPSPAASPAPAPSGTTVSAWVRLATEGESFSTTGSQTVRYGEGTRWISKTISGSGVCSTGYFGSDPAFGAGKRCEVQLTVPGVVQGGSLPVVNLALLPKPGGAFNGPRVRQLSAGELSSPSNQPTPADASAFRDPCNFSHMAFDDPIVYPKQPGVSHLHTFFGNTKVDAFSTADSIANSGDSSCVGGTLNRTGYWVPTLIDIRTGQPLAPSGAIFYYKQGYFGVKAASIQTFPKGLRMIAGNSANTSPVSGQMIRIECSSGFGGHNSSIPSCPVGDTLRFVIVFPQCWDGINLDSPDHKSHMAYGNGGGCPSSHPVPLPEVTMNVSYLVTEGNTAAFWRLSSDNNAFPGGYSLHADWFNGWDLPTNKTFTTECLNKGVDCHAYLLGDGRSLY